MAFASEGKDKIPQTELVHGSENVVDFLVEFSDKAKLRIDVCVDHTRPGLCIEIRRLIIIGIFGAINKTQNGTTIPISEAMNFFYAYCHRFQNIRYCVCHIITYTATNPSDVKMQICFGRNCCVFSTNNRYKVL